MQKSICKTKYYPFIFQPLMYLISPDCIFLNSSYGDYINNHTKNYLSKTKLIKELAKIKRHQEKSIS